MVDEYSKIKQSIVAVESVNKEATEQYGIVSVEDTFNTLGRVFSIVEKPKPVDAPSNLGVVGRYILSGRIFKILQNEMYML